MRPVPATVIRADGRRLPTLVAQLQPTSLMLTELSERLDFRERVVVDLFQLGCSVEGEVVFATAKDAGVVFKSTAGIFAAIEAYEDWVHGQPDDPTLTEAAPISTVDVPGRTAARELMLSVDNNGEILVRDALDRLGLLVAIKAGRPLVARSEHTLSRAFIGGSPAVELIALPLEPEVYVLHLSSESVNKLDDALRRDRAALDAALGKGAIVPVKKAFTADDLPVLQPDGTVHFASHAQFVAQNDAHLANGGLMTRGTPLQLNARTPLVLIIPKAERLSIGTAEVVFVRGDTTGFSIPDRDGFRAAVQARLTPQASSTQPNHELARTAGPPLRYACQLHGLPDAKTFVSLRRGEATDLALAKGWYVGIVDRALRSGRDGMLVMRNGSETTRAWFYDRRIVAVERPDAPVKDRLGERLLAARIIDPTTLSRALDRQDKPAPLGQVVLELRAATRADVNRALRRQMLERLVGPCDWDHGQINVGPWADPPGDTDLLPISGDAVVTALIRRQLQHTRLTDLRDQMQPFMSRPATVDLSQISETYRLTDKEQRYYQRAAETEGTLGKLMAVAQTRPLEGYRLVMLGMALGFIESSDR